MKKFYLLFIIILIGNYAWGQDSGSDFFSGYSYDNKVVILDNYYNHETDPETKLPYHYTWSDSGPGGFSRLGQVFKSEGAELSTLSSRPAVQRLSSGSVYIIVDPDNIKDNPHPNYMNKTDADEIEKWVRRGGKLVILTNDCLNCDLDHINILSEKFGIHFNSVSILNEGNRKNNQRDFESCTLTDLPAHPLFFNTSKIFIKGCSSISCTKKAVPVLKTKNEDIIAAESKVGKGWVLAITDPCFYNEYIDNENLPGDYQNQQFALNMVKLSLK